MKLKKLIAREGLVLIGIISMGICVIGVSSLVIHIHCQIRGPLNPTEIHKVAKGNINIPTLRIPNLFVDIRGFGYLILLYGYPVYLIIRFIHWAIRTLREKETIRA